jgi:hypothetical protein
MAMLERWGPKKPEKPEKTPIELARERRELVSLNNRMEGWDALERIEIGAVVVYGAMQASEQVFNAVGEFEAKSPAAGDAFQRIADMWLLGTEFALREYFQRRR